MKHRAITYEESTLPRALVAALCTLAITAGCTTVEERVDHRSNCLVCHQPRAEDGAIVGIEEAHPWESLTCTQCHGGEAFVCDGTLGGDATSPTCDGDWVYDKTRAHVPPDADFPEFLRNLSAAELDAVDPAYLRFINPGDLRVADQSCASADCHPNTLGAVERSTMAHTSGEVTVARYRAGAQDTPHGVYGATALQDPDFDAAGPCAVESIEQLYPEPMTLDSTDPATELSVANAQDQYLVKSCLRCHLHDFGENKFAGDMRSSGCTACHMVYEDDGLSRSTDPRISKETTPHPARHELTTAPPVQQCTHCHYRGGRLGISMQGYRESAGQGLVPRLSDPLGVAQHGHDINFYIKDEYTDNDFDETPMDVHFEAGMHCVDCHTLGEIHGDGHIYADTECAVTTRCEDCHGSVDEFAVEDSRRPNFIKRDDGSFFLRTKITNLELEAKQVKGLVTPGHADYSPVADWAMGVNEDGFSHTQELECYTCHAAWQPNCYGCHVTMDMAIDGRYQSTGELVAGRPSGKRKWVALNDMVLMRNSRGKITPSMPAERFFMTVKNGEEVTKINTKPRTFTHPDGSVMAGFGQRAYNPHTTRSRSQFMACDRCHSAGSVEAPTNAVLLDITHGFGSERFVFSGCDVTNNDESCDELTDFVNYRLDAIQTRDGTPLVIVGHEDPMESRPLTLDEVDAMRSVVADPNFPIKTEITPDAGTDPFWPAAQDL